MMPGRGKSKGNFEKWFARSLAPQALLNAGLVAAHSLKVRGVRRTVLFGALAVGLPALGEYHAVNRARSLRHHTQPQLKGVPIGALLGWYAITSATFDVAETVWSGCGLPVRTRRWIVPTTTALVATSLDLLLDCFGLDLGLWEWTDGGLYAPEIRGPNGKHGIPLGNFGGWLGLTGGVSLTYLLLTDNTPKPGRTNRMAGSPEAGRRAALLLLPYYASAAVWSLWRRKPRYLLYSALFPLALLRAFARESAQGRPE